MSKLIQLLGMIWDDIRNGENLDAYIAIALAFVLTVLDALNIVGFEALASGILVTLIFLVYGSLANRRSMKQLEKSIRDDTFGSHASLGVRRIYKDRTKIDLSRYLEEAEPGSEIKLLGVSLRTFSSAQTLDVIEKKLKEGCKVKLLTLDPKSETVRQRAAAEGQKYEELRANIIGASFIYNTFICQRPDHLRQNIELGHYTSAPAFFILCTNNTLLVSPYLSGRQGFFCPHFEIEIKEGSIHMPFLEHFDCLWNARKHPKGVQEHAN